MNKPYNEFIILVYGTGILTTLLLFWWILTVYKPSLSAKGSYNYLAIQHILTGYFHIISILLYNIIDFDQLQNLIFMIYYSFDILLTLITSCYSVILVLKLFWQINVTKKCISLFLTIFVALLEVSEEMYSWISTSTSSDTHFVIIIILLSISAFIYVLYPILSFRNYSLSTSESRYFVSTLLIFILSDIFFLFYSIYTTTVYGNYFAIILISSIILQILWCIICQIVFRSFLEVLPTLE